MASPIENERVSTQTQKRVTQRPYRRDLGAEATRSFDSYRMVVYSLVLVLMMIFRPGGLLGSYDFSMSRIVEKIMNGELFQKKAKEGKDHE